MISGHPELTAPQAIHARIDQMLAVSPGTLPVVALRDHNTGGHRLRPHLGLVREGVGGCLLHHTTPTGTHHLPTPTIPSTLRLPRIHRPGVVPLLPSVPLRCSTVAGRLTTALGLTETILSTHRSQQSQLATLSILDSCSRTLPNPKMIIAPIHSHPYSIL